MMSYNVPPSMSLQFGPWLITQISSGKYPGLEWLEGQKMKMFKIPWTKINYPMWEEHHKIFQAWAVHRGKTVGPEGEMEQSCSQIKSNFRTILRKCVEIEEVEDFHQLDLQMGNYKVYRILSKEESLVKRRALQESKKRSVNSNGRSSDGITYGRGRPPKSRRRENSSKLNSMTETDIVVQNGTTRTISTQTFVEDYSEVDYVLEPAAFEEANDAEEIETAVGSCISTMTNTPSLRFETHKIIADEQFTVKKDSAKPESASSNNARGFQMLLDAAELAHDPPQCEISDTDSSSIVEITVDKKIPPSIVDVLVELNIPPEELFTYVMHVRYEARHVMDDVELSDMSYGYRIHYGNHQVQKSLVERFQSKKEDLMEDFERTPITLPETNVPPGNSLYTVLKNLTAGLIIKSDGQYMLRVKRLCMSRVYAFTAYAEEDADTEPLLLLRNNETVLFSYNKFLEDWHRFLIHGSPKPNHEINLAFGKKTKHRHNRVFVAITLVPKAAETMLQRISDNLDDATLDNVLKLFDPNLS